MQRFVGLVRRCIEDYSMIDSGDKIAVGLSGGKDSVALLIALAKLREYYPKPFDLCAITVDMGLVTDFAPLAELCRSLGVQYEVKKTQIASVIFDVRNESNPCALCSKMRRAVLCDTANELGFKKIALGHHHDDAVETFILSLFYEGRISCFEPVTYMSRSGITQIRPMLYVTEGYARSVVEKAGAPIVKNPCPKDGESKREEVKQLVRELSAKYPDIKNKLFGAMQRYPLSGWKPNEYERH